MPTYEIQFAGRTFEIDGPHPPTRADLQSMQVRGVFGPSKTPAAPSAPADAAPEGTISDDEWAALPVGERVNRVATWIAKSIGGAFMGEPGVDAVDHPGATLASAAVPMGVLAAARSAVPYVAPAARATASVLEHPAAGAVLGGAMGAKTDGARGAVVGALAGAAGSPRIARNLRSVANRVDPPAPRVNPNAQASARMIQGMSEAGKLAATPASAPAPVASPVASTPAPPIPEAVSAPIPPAPKSAPASGMSPQMVQNQLGIMARRANLKLTPEEYQAATQLVSQGRTPAQAVAEIHLQRPAGGTPPPAPAAAAPAQGPQPELSADELDQFAKLLRIGKSQKQAAELILKQREAAQRLGIPTPAEVRRRVAERNKTGRWPTENK